MKTLLWKFSTYCLLAGLSFSLGMNFRSASAAFITSGIYDEQTNQTNTIDTVAAGSNVSLADFKTLVSSAYAANLGGVLNFDLLQPSTTGLGANDTTNNTTGSPILNVVYGLSQSEPLTITRTLFATGAASTAPFRTSTSDNTETQSISGFDATLANEKFMASSSGDGNDWRLTFSKPLTAFGITALRRPANWTIDFDVTLDDNTTVAFASETITAGANQGAFADDTFFGYVAPAGRTIQYVRANNSALGRFDDLAFVVIPEPSSAGLIVVGLSGFMWIARKRGAKPIC